jgi:hypothetical protein
MVDWEASDLLYAVLNAEWAAYACIEFSHKFKRTRKMQLTTLLKDYEDQ